MHLADFHRNTEKRPVCPQVSQVSQVSINKFGPPHGVQCVQGQNCYTYFGISEQPGRYAVLSGDQVGNMVNIAGAHEIGHTLGAPHPVRAPSSDLMSFAPTGCRVRQRDWQHVNPTPGDKP